MPLGYTVFQVGETGWIAAASATLRASGDLLEETCAIYSESDINPGSNKRARHIRIYVGFAVNRDGFFEEITARRDTLTA
jgi:hypothetical protein